MLFSACNGRSDAISRVSQSNHTAIASPNRSGSERLPPVPTSQRSLAFGVSYEAPDRVRVPMKMEDGVPRILCRVNGHEVWMILDTGSQVSILEAETARECGVRSAPPSATQSTVRGASGVESVLIGMPETLSIGEWQWHHLPCLIRTRRSMIPGRWIMSKRALSFNLLGMDAIASMCSYVCLDYPRGEVTFGFRPYPQVSQAGTGSQALSFRNGLPFVGLQIGRRETTILLDTGSAAPLEIDTATASSTGVGSDKIKMTGLLRRGMGVSRAFPPENTMEHFRLASLSLAGRELQNVEGFVVENPPKIGSGLLKDFTLTLDIKGGRLLLE